MVEDETVPSTLFDMSAYHGVMETRTALRAKRLAAGLTQRQLAGLTGIAQPRIAAYETGKVTPSEASMEVLLAACKPRPSQQLKEHKKKVIAAMARQGIRHVRVFGSIARGEDKPGSDVDLLGEFPEGFGLIDLMRLEDELQNILDVRVDLVSDAGVGRVLDNARAEAVAL